MPLHCAKSLEQQRSVIAICHYLVTILSSRKGLAQVITTAAICWMDLQGRQQGSVSGIAIFCGQPQHGGCCSW
jgi:hypothetical protein